MFANCGILKSPFCRASPGALVRRRMLSGINEVFTLLELILLRTAALAILGIYLYKQVKKHWRQR